MASHTHVVWYETGQHGSVAIRSAAAYPGDRLPGKYVFAGTFHKFDEQVTVQHTHTDDKPYVIRFYRLADGRGWLHDFSQNFPGVRQATVMVCETQLHSPAALLSTHRILL